MKRHHGDIISPFELEDRSQLHARERLEDEEQVIFLNKAVLKVMVTIRAREHDQAIWPDFLPEGLVVHRLKPFHDIVDIFEFHCKSSLASCAAATQICASTEGLN